MEKKELAVCDECGSLFFKGSSQMEALCPECAHVLYGYPNCLHHFQNGRCVNCYWNGAEHIPAASAKKAAGQYRKTRAQLMKLAAEAGEDAQTLALEVVTAYTQTFNRMNFIETEERDEIYMALCGILDALPDSILRKDILLEKFEELRDF